MVATGGQVCTFAANTSTLPLPVGTLVEPPLGLLTATMVMYNLIFEPEFTGSRGIKKHPHLRRINLAKKLELEPLEGVPKDEDCEMDPPKCGVDI